VDLLLVLGSLIATLAYAALSCARSYFERGRRRGMEEAMREMMRGVSSHCELDGEAAPADVKKAIDAFNALSNRPLSAPRDKSTDPYHAQLWRLGGAIGEACWVKGHAAGVRRKAPTEGKIRIDLSVNELLQLGWLAHLGFQHMMPNYRGFEMYRFSSEADAQEGARAVSRIEAIIPAKNRPVADLTVQYKCRQKLISDWWETSAGKLTA
jgi:hypothetical protein